MMNSNKFKNIFNRTINDYHIANNVNSKLLLPYFDLFDNMLYEKCWIDVIQWHLEDNIRILNLDPTIGFLIKQQIDNFNATRVVLVEKIDDYFVNHVKNVDISIHARLNTESIGWAIDRLSILQLKLYHNDSPVLIEQDKDLCKSIDELISDLNNGNVIMKPYRQMKTYN